MTRPLAIVGILMAGVHCVAMSNTAAAQGGLLEWRTGVTFPLAPFLERNGVIARLLPAPTLGIGIGRVTSERRRVTGLLEVVPARVRVRGRNIVGEEREATGGAPFTGRALANVSVPVASPRACAPKWAPA